MASWKMPAPFAAALLATKLQLSTQQLSALQHIGACVSIIWPKESVATMTVLLCTRLLSTFARSGGHPGMHTKHA